MILVESDLMNAALLHVVAITNTLLDIRQRVD